MIATAAPAAAVVPRGSSGRVLTLIDRLIPEMNPFSFVLPGLRQLRTPLACGLIWTAVIYCALVPGWHRTLDHGHDNVAQLVRDLSLLPTSVKAVGVILGAYILGGVSSGVSHAMAGIASKRLRLEIRRLVATKSPQWDLADSLRAQGLRLLARTEPETGTTRRLVLERAALDLAAVGAPAFVALDLPTDVVIVDLRESELLLAKELPSQYEEYDRVKAEGEFRSALSPPLFALGLIISLVYVWWVGILVMAASIVFGWQSLGYRQRAGEKLAAAIHQSALEIPAMQAIVAHLKSDLAADALQNDGAWIGSVLVVLYNQNMFAETLDMIYEVRSRESMEIRAQADAFVRDRLPDADIPSLV